MYVIPDLLEEIFLRLPLKSILKFKSLSKQWRSILESKMFTERRRKIQKKRKILAAADGDRERTKPRFSGDEEELEMVYLHCDDATRPSLTCDGLLCIPVPGCVNVLNPSTGEFLSFPSGILRDFWSIVTGFGMDKVNGSYKVVRMFFNPTRYCEILDLNIGVWRRLTTPPPHSVDVGRKSTYVNGSIYWIYRLQLLALDLHTEEFRNISLPKKCAMSDQVVNLEDRLALVRSNWLGDWKLEILILDAQEENWSMAYSVNLGSFAYPPPNNKVLFKPLAVSKKGNLFLCDSKKRLFKYYPETNSARCIVGKKYFEGDGESI